MAINSVEVNDIGTPEYRILVYLWDRTGSSEEGKINGREFIVDISALATSDITINKERNQPDSLEVTIEYAQFKRKLKQEGSFSQNVLQPWLTEIKIQRNFKTVFMGTLYSMVLSLNQVGSEQLTLRCMSWGQLLDKRLVSRGFRNMSYPQIAQALIYEAQHELNWIENYGFEASDDESYFSEWLYDDNPDPDHKPERARDYYWGTASKVGIILEPGHEIKCPAQITTRAIENDDLSYTLDTNNYHGEEVIFQFDHYNSKAETLTLTIWTGTFDNMKVLDTKTFIVPASPDKWSTYGPEELVFKEGNITFISFKTSGKVALGEFQMYRRPIPGDIYDLGLKQGIIDPTYTKSDGSAGMYIFEETRVRHYHQMNVKDALYNLTKLEADQFEFEFTEDKVFNCYKYIGTPVVEPTFIATYPGIIQSLTVERTIEDIMNVSYAHSDETKKLEIPSTDGGEDTKDYIRRWKYAAQEIRSTDRYGALVALNTYEGAHSYEDVKIKAIEGLKLYADIQNIPTITVDSNIYNPDNLHVGDAVGVKVLEDELFTFINDVYRVFSLTINVTKDSVEAMKFTLITPSMSTIQMISFPKQLKIMQSTIRRLQER